MGKKPLIQQPRWRLSTEEQPNIIVVCNAFTSSNMGQKRGHLTKIGENTTKVAQSGTVKYNDLIGEVERSTGRGLRDWLFRSGTSQGGQTAGVGTNKGRRETDACLPLSNPPTLPPPPELPPPWPPPWPSPNKSINAKIMEESRKQRPKARWSTTITMADTVVVATPKSTHDADPLSHQSIQLSHRRHPIPVIWRIGRRSRMSLSSKYSIIPSERPP